MGSFVGKESVEEPPYEVLLNRHHPHAKVASYEIRKYGERFAVQAEYAEGDKDDGTPFRILARYIGVFGAAENEGGEKIDMTAPVVREGGTPIAMTAPVVRSDNMGTKKMQFMLPSSYDSISKIPRPTDPRVQIKEIPPATGAVHRFAYSFSEDHCHEMAMDLMKQLREDGLEMDEARVMSQYQSWGYNPPWTLPMMKRNEVWLPLTSEEVDTLLKAFAPN